MAVTRVHNFNAAGALTSTSLDEPGSDDDPMANLPPGTRVHKDEEIETAGVRRPTPSELESITGEKIPTKAKTKPAKVAKTPVQPDLVSDRRRCLELAVQSGATDADEVLAVAGRFLAFLEPE